MWGTCLYLLADLIPSFSIKLNLPSSLSLSLSPAFKTQEHTYVRAHTHTHTILLHKEQRSLVIRKLP